MNFDDLRVFLTVVRAGTLQQAAGELHQTPSALSRALRRLEQSLNTSLFDRAGKQLRLNADGQRLHQRALSLQREVEDTRAEFLGGAARLSCRLAGPAALLWRHAPQAARHLTARYPDSALALQVQYEDAALQAVARGDADFALVTQVALALAMTAGVQALELAPITMQLAAGANHPLLQGHNGPEALRVTTAAVLMHDFACPGRSLFCGIDRGARADGWRDDRLPRRIRYWVDDLQLLITLVRDGHALAYLPDFALAQSGLVRLQVEDCPYHCVEAVRLVWHPGHAAGWHLRLIEAFAATA